MNKQANQSRYLPMLIVGVAVILFSTAGVARMMGWGPNLSGEPGSIGILDQEATAAVDKSSPKPRCPECGTIVSMRENDGQGEHACSRSTGTVADGIPDGIPERLPGGYEVTVRMADGSSRVMNLASPAKWRAGERLIVIGAIGPSN